MRVGAQLKLENQSGQGPASLAGCLGLPGRERSLASCLTRGLSMAHPPPSAGGGGTTLGGGLAARQCPFKEPLLAAPGAASYPALLSLCLQTPPAAVGLALLGSPRQD